jgi:hypothetical protein
MKTIVLLLGAIAPLLGACYSMTEMQLAPNVYRVETDASGLLFAGKSGQQTLKRAAELTLQNGYTHFKIADASLSTGSQFVGYTPSYVSGQATATQYGNTTQVYGNGWVNNGTAIHKPTSKAAATVIMLRAGDPGVADAFDAAAVLAKPK